MGSHWMRQSLCVDTSLALASRGRLSDTEKHHNEARQTQAALNLSEGPSFPAAPALHASFNCVTASARVSSLPPPGCGPER